MGGSFLSTDVPEIWQCTIRGTPTASGDFDYGDEDAALEAIQDAVGDWFELPTHNIRSDANLQYLKLNEIAPDGSYADAGTSHTYDYSPARLGSNSTPIPTILTLALSWTTARTRGIGARGRIYPPLVIPLGNTDRVSSASQEAARDTAYDLLKAISNPSSGTFVIAPCVVSKGAKGGTGAGIVEDITGIRVGDVLDVQRRRKNALPENYISRAFP